VTRFRDSAARLAGVAGALLGWRPDEFWAATPAEILSIVQCLAAQHEPDVRAGADDLGRMMEMFPDG